MTKKDAALQLLGVALAISGAMAGDEGADIWVTQLLWIAADLDKGIVAHPRYVDAVTEHPKVEVKLRRLIEHPSTPSAERDAAVAALDRVRRAREVSNPASTPSGGVVTAACTCRHRMRLRTCPVHGAQAVPECPHCHTSCERGFCSCGWVVPDGERVWPVEDTR